MKPRHILIFIFSLLLASFLPGKAYAEQSSQTMGSNNKNSPQINGSGNTIYYINNSLEATPNINQPNSVPEETEAAYSSSKPGGYTPVQNSSPQISNSGGYTPTQLPEPKISTY